MSEAEELLRVLVVDDASMRRQLEESLGGESFEVRSAAGASDALNLATRGEVDVVIVDAGIPGPSGLETLERLKALDEPPEVIVFTEEASVETAVQAMQIGAFDYLEKPVRAADIVSRVRRAAERHRLRHENRMLKRLVDHHQFSGEIISESPQMKAVLETVAKIAPSDAPVMLLGETGTGKSLIAKKIHQVSDRAKKSFIHVNCGGLQEQLVQSEFFGHEQGAFTGASRARPGLFEVADRGTLFLDEVTELSLGMQAELLQVLDTGELRRVGGNTLRRVDVRIFAATNKDIEEEARRGHFRQDLLFRLNVVSLTMPPLRERTEDIDLLIELYLRRFGQRDNRPERISPEARCQLREYDWPGNVRELANTMQQAILLSSSRALQPEDLPGRIRPEGTVEHADGNGKPRPLREMERLHIQRVLEYTDRKRGQAAKLLGIDVKTLRNKLRRYRLDGEEPRPGTAARTRSHP